MLVLLSKKNFRWKELLAYDLLRLILMVFVMNLFRKRRNPSQERTTGPADFIYSVLGEITPAYIWVDLVEKRAKPCAIVIAIFYIIIGLTGLLPDLRYAQVDTTRMTHHRTEGVLFWNSETGLHRPGHCSSFLPCHSIPSDPSIQ